MRSKSLRIITMFALALSVSFLSACGGTSSSSSDVISADTQTADLLDPGDTVAADTGDSTEADTGDSDALSTDSAPQHVRLGQFNIELLRTSKLTNEFDLQIRSAAQIIARFAPDIVSLNELQFEITKQNQFPGDVETDNPNLTRFLARLKDAGQTYEHKLVVLGNWGFKWNGYIAGTHDPYFNFSGSANVPGLISIGLLSRYPILLDRVRVITDFAWSDLPGNRIAELKKENGVEVPDGFPLFTTALVVVPVNVAGTVYHLILQHTRSPVPLLVQKYQNRDQLLALKLFIEGKLPGHDPLPQDARFVLIGDFNADPDHGDTFPEASLQLLNHPQLHQFNPTGAGTYGVNPQFNTTASVCHAVSSPDPTTGVGFRLDYILPSKSWGEVLNGGMFFPDHKLEPMDWDLACSASNHMFLWADLPL